MDDITFKLQPIRELEDGKKYHVTIKIPQNLGWIEHVQFVLDSNNYRSIHQLKHIKNDKEYAYFSTEIDLGTKAIYHYYFSFEANGNYKCFKKENTTGDTNVSLDEMWKLSVNYSVPDWAKGKIMYQIFVDRFNRGSKEPLPKMPRRNIHENWDEPPVIGPAMYDDFGNEIWCIDFYGGDLKGIEKALDYLDFLGVSIIYLGPVMRSQSNHRYDTADYEQVDPYAGTNDDLKALCDAAHKRGMKVILDAVFNHTGNDSKYFNQYNTYEEKGAFQGQDSKYFPFYRTYYANNETHFNYWWGQKNLPECDGNSKEWQDFIYGENGVIDQWFRLGIDGLRLDVADELTDDFIAGIRRAVKRNKEDGFILGEVWENPMRKGRGFIESGKCMDSVMDYALVDALIRYFKYNDVWKLAETLRQLRTEYPQDTLNSLMNFTSTHDISRAINIFATNQFQQFGQWAWNPNHDEKDHEWFRTFNLTKEEYEYGKELYKAYLYTLTFLPGNLSIFYGDEIGIEGMGNIMNRKPFTWNKRDVNLLNFFRYLGTIRKKEKFLEQAELKVVDINSDLFMFERTTEQESSLIAVNRTPYDIPLSRPSEYEKYDGIYRLKESTDKELKPYGGITLKKIKK